MRGSAAAEPMLARAGTIPHGRGWTFEPKLAGSLHGLHAAGLRPSVPAGLQLDGELVALAYDGRPTSTGSPRGCCMAARGSR
jgi:hypothetical protein